MSYTEPTGRFKRRHGLDFPVELSDFNIDLLCWKNWRQPEYRAGNIKDPHELFIGAVRMTVNGLQVLTEKEWGLSRWAEQHVFWWTHEASLTCFGCASSGKSFDFGLLALLDFYVSPHETVTLMCSTSKEALQRQSFAAVTHFHRLFLVKGLPFPGYDVPSKTAILLSQDEHVGASTKNGIFGIAVKDGPVAQAVGRIRGSHCHAVRLVVEEASAMPAAVFDSRLRLNLMAGAQDAKIIFLSNFDSVDDSAGRQAEPVGGWSSINIDTEVWKSRLGTVLRHDGFKSPAIVEPNGAERFPYLLNKKTLDAAIEGEGGDPDAVGIMLMYRAFAPDSSTKPVIVTPVESIKWGMRSGQSDSAPLWRSPPVVVAGLDGSQGGDTVAFQPALVGMVDTGHYRIWFEPEERVPIKGGAGADTVTAQILAYCLPRIETLGIKPEHLGIDDSGPQGLADAFALHLSNAIRRFSFGSKAGDLEVSAFDHKKAYEKYADTATELGYLYRMYGLYGQLKNVGAKAIRQLTTRVVIHRGGKLALIDKKTFKKQTGQKSPDEMDAGGLALGVVRYVLRLAPGATDVSPAGPIEAQVNPGQGLDPEIVDQLNNLRSDYGVK